MDRLHTSLSNGNGITYSIDPWGNLTNITLTSGQGSTGCLGQATTANHINGLGYDLDGNIGTDCMNSYEYDAEDRLSWINDWNGTGTTYEYGPEGNRVATLASGKVVAEYLYDFSGNLETTVDGSGNLVNAALQGAGLHAGDYTGSMTSSGNTIFRAEDLVGSLFSTWAANGNNMEFCHNEPYGEDLQCTPSIDYAQTNFAGKKRDIESNLDYFGARYYSSAMGRFMSPDEPFIDQNSSDPQSWNLYGYARNNPLSNIDPSGEDCVTQTRTSDTTESVSVNSGGCSGNVGDGQSQTYVNGTVTGISVNGGNSIDIGYNSYDGSSSGVTNAASAPIPDNPGIAFGYNQAGYNQLAGASRIVNAAGSLEMNIMVPWAGALAGCSSGGNATSCGASLALALLPETAALREGAALLRAGRGLNAAEILQKSGGFSQALKDFESLPGKETVMGDLRTKTLLDGTKVTVRNFSKAGPPTLELHAPSGVITKYRY